MIDVGDYILEELVVDAVHEAQVMGKELELGLSALVAEDMRDDLFPALVGVGVLEGFVDFGAFL